MRMLRRMLAAVAVLSCVWPTGVAMADDAPSTAPRLRVSCPGVRDVAQASGMDLSSLTASPSSCRYATSPGDGPRQRVTFTFAAGSERDGAHYWHIGPGAVGRLTGVEDRSKATATARLFRPQMEVHTVPGLHHEGGRRWRTTCEPYSQTTRCRTEIWATTLVPDGGAIRSEEGWAFNSMTYLWSKRSGWAGNPLARPGVWVADGRVWRTECDTAGTGRGACRNYVHLPTVRATDDGLVVVNNWVLNSQVLFS